MEILSADKTGLRNGRTPAAMVFEVVRDARDEIALVNDALVRLNGGPAAARGFALDASPETYEERQRYADRRSPRPDGKVPKYISAGSALPDSKHLPPTVIGTDGDLVRTAGIDRYGALDFSSRRIAMAPNEILVMRYPSSADHVIALRELVGDRQFILSAPGVETIYRPAVIGTDSHAGRGAEVLRDAEATQRWYRDVAGLDLWPAGTRARFFTNSRNSLLYGGAAATVLKSVPETYEAPRAGVYRDWLLSSASAEQRDTLAKVAEHATGVRTHEGAHVLMLREWPVGLRAGNGEHGVVQEAIADLFAAARTGRPTIGVRDLDVLPEAAQTLDQLRRSGERLAPHVGTQLLTKPMVRVLETHGGSVLAKVLSDTVLRIGHRMRAEDAPTPTTISGVAATLLESSKRHGVAQPVLTYLEDTWKLLGVLR